MNEINLTFRKDSRARRVRTCEEDSRSRKLSRFFLGFVLRANSPLWYHPAQAEVCGWPQLKAPAATENGECAV